jgi:hypothetical protein
MVFWSYGLVVGHPQPAERVTLSWSKGGFVVLWSFGVMSYGYRLPVLNKLPLERRF